MKKFKLADQEISFNKNFEYYHKYVNEFTRIAYLYANEFEKDIEAFDTINDFIEKTPQIANEYIDKAIYFCIDLLLENDIFDYDINRFKEDYEEDIIFEEGDNYSELAKRYGDISQKEFINEEKKAQIRANRSHWTGGGFGVTGAIKGAVTAGAMNMAVGVFRGIGDSLEDSSDRRKFNNMKEKLLTEDVALDMAEDLWDIIYYGISADFGDIMEEYGKPDVTSIVWGNEKKAHAIFNNLERVDSKEKKRKLLSEVLNLNPYNREYLHYLYYAQVDLEISKKEIVDFINYVDCFFMEELHFLNVSNNMDSILMTEDICEIPIDQLEDMLKELKDAEFIDDNLNIKPMSIGYIDKNIEFFIYILAMIYIQKVNQSFKERKIAVGNLTQNDLIELLNQFESILKRFHLYDGKKIKQSFVEFSGVREDLHIFSALKHELDIKSRSAYGKVFDTEEDANEYRKAVETFKNNFYASYDTEELQRVISEIQGYRYNNSEIKLYIADLENKKVLLESRKKTKAFYDGNIILENLRSSNVKDLHLYGEDCFSEYINELKDKFQIFMIGNDRPLAVYKSEDTTFIISDEEFYLIKEALIRHSLENFCAAYAEKNNLRIEFVEEDTIASVQFNVCEAKADNLAKKINEGLESVKKYIQCPYCKKYIESNSQFCENCGSNLMNMDFYIKYCPNCGEKCEAGNYFCENCGYKLR